MNLFLKKIPSLKSYQCFPLHLILRAVGNPTVDLFSLDVEGADFQVIKGIPFEQVDIRYFDTYNKS